MKFDLITHFKDKYSQKWLLLKESKDTFNKPKNKTTYKKIKNKPQIMPSSSTKIAKIKSV